MLYEDDEDFELVGGSDEPDDEVQETTQDDVQEETTSESKEEAEEKPDEEEETADETPKKDSRIQALDSERAKRKQAEKELRELKAQIEAEKTAKEDGERAIKERETYKQKMLEGDLIDEETANKLLDVFGDDIIKGKIANERRAEELKFDQAIQDLKKDSRFIDADVYKPQIKEFMQKGLTPQQAYMASLSDGRFAQLKKDLEIEAEQKFLNRNDKLDNVDVGVAQAKGEVKKGTYTRREQEIARETGLPVAEVHKRSQMFTMEEIEKL